MNKRVIILFFSLALILVCIRSHASNGLKDLRNQSFEGNIFVLRDNWQVHAGHLLSPEQTDTAYWENVNNVPTRWDLNTWRGKPMGLQGMATYRLGVIMPDADVPLGFKLYEVLSAYRLFINGKQIFECGTVSENPDKEIPNYNSEILTIPGNYQKGDTLKILLQVSNWHFLYGAIKSKPQIGDLREMYKYKSQRISIDGLLLGAIGMIGLSQLILFLFRRRNLYYLYLFLVSVNIFLRLALVDEMLLRNIIPSIEFFTIVKLRWITTFFSVPLAILFVYSFFPGFIKKWILYFFLAFAFVHSFISLVFPFTLKVYYAYHVHVIMMIGAIYLIYICIKAAMEKQSGARTLLLGLLITIPFLVNDILYAQFVSPIGNIIGWGVMAFFISLFTVTSKRFSVALQNEEKLTAELSEMNRNLEEKVLQRTHHIEEKNKLIEEQHESLKTLLKDQEALIAIVAHDLKAPLNRAAGLAEIMSLTGDLSQDQLQINKKIIDVTKSGHKLIDQLTALRKFEDTNYELQLEEIDISHLFTELTVEHKRKADEKKIQLNSDIENNLKGKSNRDALSRIFDNLVSNAIKFSPSLGAVSIKAFKDNENLKLIITDSGPGFTEEDKKKAFQKFQKLSARSTGGESSTGLGLYIIKTLVEKLNGKLDLQCEEGKGSTFEISIPL